MPFVKELCKCVKHFLSDEAVHWKERSPKITLGSCGSPKCTGRIVDMNQLSIHKLWVSIKLFSHTQKPHHHDLPRVGLEYKRHCFFSLCVKKKSFLLLRRSWSSGGFCFVFKVCFAFIGHQIYWVCPRAAETATILSNSEWASWWKIGTIKWNRWRVGTGLACQTSVSTSSAWDFVCLHWMCSALRLAFGVKAESWHWGTGDKTWCLCTWGESCGAVWRAERAG